MIYQNFQNLKLSALGLGAMRLPAFGDNLSKIDEAAAAVKRSARSRSKSPKQCRISMQGWNPLPPNIKSNKRLCKKDSPFCTAVSYRHRADAQLCFYLTDQINHLNRPKRTVISFISCFCACAFNGLLYIFHRNDAEHDRNSRFQ